MTSTYSALSPPFSQVPEDLPLQVMFLHFWEVSAKKNCLKPSSDTCYYVTDNCLCAEMLRGAKKLRFHWSVCAIFMRDKFARKHRLLSKFVVTLTYHFPVMGVTVSSKRENRINKQVPKPSFASFSTSGTLTTDSCNREDVEGELFQKPFEQIQAKLIFFYSMANEVYDLSGSLYQLIFCLTFTYKRWYQFAACSVKRLSFIYYFVCFDVCLRSWTSSSSKSKQLTDTF